MGYRHYVRATDGKITDGWSSGEHPGRVPANVDFLIEANGGAAFALLGVEHPELTTEDGISRYLLDGVVVSLRSDEDIDAERAQKEKEKEEREAEEKRRIAEATETVLMQAALDHEERLCMLELGLNQ